MDVPKGYISIIKTPVPVDVTADVTVSMGGISLPSFEVVAENKVLAITLPYAATHSEGAVDVKAVFEVEGFQYTRDIGVNVVTPYIELHEIKEILGKNASDEECFQAEAAARQIINAHTGQEFGFFEGTIKVLSNYDEALPLPRRMIEPTKIVAGSTVIFDRNTPTSYLNYLGENQFVVTGSGMFLKRPIWASSLVVGDMYSADPIEAPSYTGVRKFENDILYTITGKFGYETVPEAVRQAAQILTEQYECADKEYREQYLESIKSADWRIQFNSGAYRRTGNARADKLLSPYVVNRAKVI
jgi:hypothetical protein